MNCRLRLQLAVACVAASIVTAGQVQAALIQYDNRPTFEAATLSLLTEDFNSFVSDVNLAGGAVVDIGDFTVTGPASGIARIDAGGDGITPVNGTAYIQGIGAPGSSIDFTFDSAITAFGVDLFGINDGRERTRVVIGGNTYFLPVVGGNESSFFGFTSHIPFTTVSFEVIVGEDAGLDNVSYGQHVPEPTSLALLGMGVAGLGGYRMRRKRKTELTA